MLQILDLLMYLQTPIVKMLQRKRSFSILLRKYEEWKNTHPNYQQSGWKSKYYKGLGTSTTSGSKGYFKICVKWNIFGTLLRANTIDMAFNKDRSEDRKSWLKQHDEKIFLKMKHTFPI